MKKYVFTLPLTFCACFLLASNQASLNQNSEPNTLFDTIQPGNMMLNEYIKLGVEAEFLATYQNDKTRDGDSDDANDFVLDIVDISLDVDVTDNIKFSTVVEYADDEDIVVDSAQFDVALDKEGKVLFSIGKLYLPFGRFNGDMISDPLTLELGEMRKTAAGLSYSPIDAFSLSAWVFSGDIEEEFNNAAVCVELTPVDSIAFGAGLITDICEGVISDSIELENEDGELLDYKQTMGLNAWVELYLSDSFSMFGEYMLALDEVEALDNNQPKAWSIDLVYAITDSVTIAARYEGSKDFLVDEMPEIRVGGTLSYAFNDVVSVSAEYLYSEYNCEAELDYSHAATARLAFAF